LLHFCSTSFLHYSERLLKLIDGGSPPF